MRQQENFSIWLYPDPQPGDPLGWWGEVYVGSDEDDVRNNAVQGYGGRSATRSEAVEACLQWVREHHADMK